MEIELNLRYKIKHKLKFEANKILNNWRVPARLNRTKSFADFDEEKYKYDVGNYFNTLQISGSPAYKYCNFSNTKSLYPTLFAVSTYSLIDRLKFLSKQERLAISEYIKSHQRADGLFWEESFSKLHDVDQDWWGPRHLSLLAVNALTVLGSKPSKRMKFLDEFIKNATNLDWLGEKEDWRSFEIMQGDVDNKIWNIGGLLQYQIDVNDCQKSERALFLLKDELRCRINSITGIWGPDSFKSSWELSRSIQFAYHLLPLFTKVGDFEFNHEKIVNIALESQNKFGGFGIQPNSSACEDIDSIEILIRFHPYVSQFTKKRIERSLIKAFKWILANQNLNGGMNFRMYSSFQYGTDDFIEAAGASSSFATWFRTLALAYCYNFLSDSDAFNIQDLWCYEFPS